MADDFELKSDAISNNAKRFSISLYNKFVANGLYRGESK